MPEDANHNYVAWGRYDAEHQALIQRVAVTEGRLEELRGAEQEHRAIIDRIAVLEGTSKADTTSEQGRRERIWLIVIGLMTGIISPLVVTTIITWLHLRSLK